MRTLLYDEIEFNHLSLTCTPYPAHCPACLEHYRVTADGAKFERKGFSPWNQSQAAFLILRYEVLWCFYALSCLA